MVGHHITTTLLLAVPIWCFHCIIPIHVHPLLPIPKCCANLGTLGVQILRYFEYRPSELGDAEQVVVYANTRVLVFAFLNLGPTKGNTTSGHFPLGGCVQQPG